MAAAFAYPRRPCDKRLATYSVSLSDELGAFCSVAENRNGGLCVRH